jgi:DNA-binding IclR family transcriptional regulator
MAQPRDYTIAAVDLALDLLEALRRHGPASLAELAAAAGCTRPAAFRLLHTLAARGYAVQEEARGPWRLGARLPALGAAAETQGALKATVAPRLREAARELGENLHLLLRVGSEADVAAVIPAAERLRRYAEQGTRLPLHAGPCRLLLAAAPASLQARVMALPLARIGPATRTSRQWLLAELGRLASRDGLVTAEELFEDAIEIAVPLRDAGGRALAVVAVLSPAFRARPARRRALLSSLQAAVAPLERLLGA